VSSQPPLHRIPIVIPFYREREKLERCLQHLHAQTRAPLEIFVRDNSEDNIYFTAAVNEGLRKFCYDDAIPYVVILNQDAYLAPNAIQVLAEFLAQNPQSGIAAPIQLTPQGIVTWGGSWAAFPTGVHRSAPLETFTAPFETYWANGAALMVRTEVVREVGLWDRNYRFICSDADFSFTARTRGWKVHVVPDARCTHDLSSSGVDLNLELERIKLADLLYFAMKWPSGDLYRELSFEGRTLTEPGVRQDVDRIKRAIDNVQQKIAAAQPPKG